MAGQHSSRQLFTGCLNRVAMHITVWHLLCNTDAHLVPQGGRRQPAAAGQQRGRGVRSRRGALPAAGCRPLGPGRTAACGSRGGRYGSTAAACRGAAAGSRRSQRGGARRWRRQRRRPASGAEPAVHLVPPHQEPGEAQVHRCVGQGAGLGRLEQAGLPWDSAGGGEDECSRRLLPCTCFTCLPAHACLRLLSACLHLMLHCGMHDCMDDLRLRCAPLAHTTCKLCWHAVSGVPRLLCASILCVSLPCSAGRRV